MSTSLSPGIAVRSASARMALRSRTASPAVGHRITAVPSRPTAPTTQSTAPTTPVIMPRATSQFMQPTSPRTSLEANKPYMKLEEKILEEKPNQDKARAHVSAELQAFSSRVDELKDRMDWLFAQPPDRVLDSQTDVGLLAKEHFGLLAKETVTTRQETKLTGHSTPASGVPTDISSSWSEAGTSQPDHQYIRAESHIEAAVEAKVAAVLDVALQKFNAFAAACLQRYSDEVSKDRNKKDLAVQEQIAQLRAEVNELRTHVGQVAVQEPMLLAETGASPSDNSNLPTIYEDGTSVSTSQRVSNVKSGEILPEMNSKWEALRVDDVHVASEATKSSEQLTGCYLQEKTPAAYDKLQEWKEVKVPPWADSTNAQTSPTSSVGTSQNTSWLNKVREFSASPARAAYWDENKIGNWYSETSKIVRECEDPVTAHHMIKQRWQLAEGHIPHSIRPILLQGLDEMKKKVTGYIQRQSQAPDKSRSPERKDLLLP